MQLEASGMRDLDMCLFVCSFVCLDMLCICRFRFAKVSIQVGHGLGNAQATFSFPLLLLLLPLQIFCFSVLLFFIPFFHALLFFFFWHYVARLGRWETPVNRREAQLVEKKQRFLEQQLGKQEQHLSSLRYANKIKPEQMIKTSQNIMIYISAHQICDGNPVMTSMFHYLFICDANQSHYGITATSYDITATSYDLPTSLMTLLICSAMECLQN